MARGDDPLQRANIDVQASGPGARLQGPSTDSALQLAAALSDIQPAAQAAMQGYAKDQAEAANAQARTDALSTGGMALSDAVRAGKLEPTSNPWYVEAYQRNSGAVRGQDALSQLQIDSASWAEKNDPAAFASKWHDEVGKIADGFGTTAEQEGFAPVAAQATQQAIQSNTSQVISATVTQRTQDISSLTANALTTALKANGGQLTPNQAAEAIKPAYAQWMQTGGTQADWNTKVLVPAVTTAGYYTSNAGVLDLLKAPELIHGPSDGGNTPIGDGTAPASQPIQITPMAPVPASAVAPGKRWSSDELAAQVPFGGKVTSGVRSAAHNAAIGGVANSQHVAGTAIDVVFPAGTTTAQVQQHYAALGLRWT